MRGTNENESSAAVPALADKQFAAALLGKVSTRTVDRLRMAGELDTVVVGQRSVRITVTSIERYLARQLPASEFDSAAEVEEADPFSIPFLADLKAQAAERRAKAVA